MDAIINQTVIPIKCLPAVTINAALVIAVALIVTSFVGIRLLGTAATHDANDALEVTQLYCYPVKGLRGCALQKAELGKFGIVGDRVFSLQRVHRDATDDTKKRYETIFIGRCLQLGLFQTSFHLDGEQKEISVSWHGRDSAVGATSEGLGPSTADEIRFPLSPSVEGREEYDVSLHASHTKAYDMGDEFSSWFSERLGFETRLVYIGHESRPVLGSLAPHSKGGLRRANFLERLQAWVPFLSLPEERLVFSDLGHYLVVTEESNDEVSSRLEDGCSMDITKFRPNIVVKGASGPFVEDFWSELKFDAGVRMPLTSNCFRCQSITVDFDTGKAATDDSGLVWKKLAKDRRVDKGAKYSPVFGRYGYCFGSSVGKTLSVGEKVDVTRRNTERTIFDWPSLTTFGVSQTKK